MKKVEAILNPNIFAAVRELLISRGCQEFVISEVSGATSNGTRMKRYRGTDYTAGEPKLKLETIVADEDAMATAQAILAASHSYEASEPAVSLCALEGVISIGILRLDEQRIDSHVSSRGGLLSTGSSSS
ncbi:MAG: P-II family nitrogen regulator [Candidatus Binataceae bacterium]